MKKIVLFGSSGCFGTAFSEICKKINNVDLVELSHLDIDVLNEKKVYDCISALQPDVVINAVSIVGINPCEENPDLSFSIHATAVKSMAIASEKVGAIFVQTSSHAIFDGTSNIPYVESDIPNAGSIYAVSKYSGELIASMWCKKCYIVRFPTMYGPRRNQAFGFVDKVISWLREGRELNIASDKIDSPTYSLDAALAIYELIDKDMPYGTWHIANNGVVSYYDFVVKLAELLNFSNTVNPSKDSDFPGLAPKPLYTALTTEKQSPMRPWKMALSDYVKTLNK